MILKPSLINYHNMQFLITHAPDNDSLPIYVKELQEYNVTTLVRTCERTYNDQLLKDAGIRVFELEFADGAPPSKSIITTWLKITRDTFSKRKSISQRAPVPPPSKTAAKYDASIPTIAIHCVAGLGRAPVLVAIALVEHGMESLRAVDQVRKARKDAMNNAQVEFLMKYKRKKSKGCCTIF